MTHTPTLSDAAAAFAVAVTAEHDGATDLAEAARRVMLAFAAGGSVTDQDWRRVSASHEALCAAMA